jgi:hypothetical protein
LQTLLHLRRESLLLRDSRDEFHSCHHLKGDDATREGKQLLGRVFLSVKKLMAYGRLNCHKAGPEEGNNQPSTMKTSKKAKGRVLQGIKHGAGTEEVGSVKMFL